MSIYAIRYFGGIMAEYRNRLKDIREERDLKQSDIAKILETIQEQISKYETGKQLMGIDKYMKLAVFYNVSIDYLTGLIPIPERLDRSKK